MRYAIRTIEPGDDRAVEAVIRSCLIEFHADHAGTAWADPDLGRFSSLYSASGRRYWVAEDEAGKLVGGTGIGPLPGHEEVCELQKMYCLPEARGTGLAHRLLDEALAFAAAHYDWCYLETLDNMAAAQRFYEKRGFRRIHEPGFQTSEHFLCDVQYLLALKKRRLPIRDL